MINRKIDPSILYKVTNNSLDEKDEIDCIIYSNNYNITKQFLLRQKNCQIKSEYPFIKAFALTVKPKLINSFCCNNHISYITSGAKVFAQVNVSKKIMNLDALYEDNLFGDNVTIAFIDTGIKQHLDFSVPKNRIIYFKDFINKKTDAYDDNGHGTFVASVACGNGFCSGKKYSGVAPKSNIVSLKALDSNGETGAFTILEAMQWIYDNHKKYNIKVVCMSFGSQPLQNNDPLLRGAETLWDEGIIIVAAAGNSGPDNQTIKSPGISSKIITVGALDDARNQDETFNSKDFKVADFSSRGPAYNFYKPDLITSGVNLICCSNKSNELYTKMSGTSVATPLVAGLCGLIKQKYPNISPYEVKYFIINNCTKITGDRNKEGFGYFNLKIE